MKSSVSAFLIFLLAILVSGVTAFSSRKRIDALTPVGEDLLLGELTPGNSISGVLRCRNNSGKKIEDINVVTSCSCAVVEKPQSIAAGGIGEFKYFVTLPIDFQKEKFHVELVATFGVNKLVRSWRLEGPVKRQSLWIDGKEFVLGKVDFGSEVSKTVDLEMDDPLIESIEVKSNAIHGKFASQKSKSANAFRITFAPNTRTEVGNYMGGAEVLGIGSDKKVRGRRFLPYSYSVIRDVYIVSSIVELGVNSVGAVGKCGLTLQSRTQQSFDISRINAPSWLSIVESSLAGDSVRTFVLSGKPDDGGEQIGKIEFQVSQDVEYTLSVPFHGYWLSGQESE